MGLVNCVLKAYQCIQDIIGSLPAYVQDWLEVVFSVIGIAAIINAVYSYTGMQKQ